MVACTYCDLYCISGADLEEARAAAAGHRRAPGGDGFGVRAHAPHHSIREPSRSFVQVLQEFPEYTEMLIGAAEQRAAELRTVRRARIEAPIGMRGVIP